MTTGIKLSDQLASLLEEENPQSRGYIFEKFLHDFFSWGGLRPRRSFRLEGEQIDGSIMLGDLTYIIEAKWQSAPTGKDDLISLDNKVQRKVNWSRGLFVSRSGFSEQALEYYARGPSRNLICMDLEDIKAVLENIVGLRELLSAKARSAAESGAIFASAKSLFPERFHKIKHHPPTPGLRIITAQEHNELWFKNDPHRDFHTWWDRVSEPEIDTLCSLLADPDLFRLRNFLSSHPHLLVEHLRGGHGRYVIPGNRFQDAPPVDFLIAERSSIGLEWTVVELKSPATLPVESDGKLAQDLEDSCERIREWRNWLNQEIDFARRAVKHGGLELSDIEINTPGLILMGRRSVEKAPGSSRLKSLRREDIEVHSYDWLAEYLLNKFKQLNFRHT